ncbi:restriction endonuclease subunit S, partial [Chryseobacterium sp. NRRL B-14859]|uniref:restriction endonuclease subunit S n=1 Tax=Chryseobacterium sp. NRRL B-14859 TaxID=1562763 RepID=UPI00339A441D
IQTQKKIIEQLETLMKANREKLFSQKLRFKDEQGNYFSDWGLTELKNVCFIIGGGTPDTQKSEFWNGNIQWFTPTEIKSNFVFKSERSISELGLKNSSAKILPQGSILLTTRATIGEVAIAQEECTTNQGFQSLIVKENCNNIFLFHWIKENKFELIKRANGSTFPEISKSEIELIKISLPSIKEQTKIANFLSLIQEKIETEKQILEKLELQKKSLLANLFV